MIHFIRQSVLVKLLLFGSSCIYGCDPVFFPSCGTFVFSCVYLRLKAASDGFSFISFIHAFMKPRFLFVCLFWFFLFFFFFVFLWPHLCHMEVPRLGVKSELQLRPTPQPWPHQIQAASVTYTTVCSNTNSLTH